MSSIRNTPASLLTYKYNFNSKKFTLDEMQFNITFI